MISQEEKQKLADKLNEKFSSNGLKCPMCGNTHFIIADGYFNNTMQSDLNGLRIGGPSIPSIPIICDKCGFISMHALGVIGMLSIANEKEKEVDNGK